MVSAMVANGGMTLVGLFLTKSGEGAVSGIRSPTNVIEAKMVRVSAENA